MTSADLTATWLGVSLPDDGAALPPAAASSGFGDGQAGGLISASLGGVSGGVM